MTYNVPQRRLTTFNPRSAFALRAYLETLLLSIGWDPSTTPPQAFITQYSWLLAEELKTTPEKAAKIFLELYDKTTPSLEAVCHAIIGMEEKLECSRETSRSLRYLFKVNHDCTPERMLKDGGDKVEEKVGVGTLSRKWGKRQIWKRIMVGLWRSVFGGGEKRKKGKARMGEEEK